MRQQLTEKLKIVPIKLCLFFTLLAGGCVPGVPTEQPVPIFTAPVSDTPTVTPTPEQEPSSQFHQPIPLVIDRICPDDSEVSLSELNLAPSLRMIVTPVDVLTDFFMTMSGVDVIPQNIPGVHFDKRWQYEIKSISPDRKWLIYSRQRDRDEAATFWLVSVDGKDEHQLPLAYKRTNILWVSDDKAIIRTKSRSEADETLLIMSPFTQEMREIIELEPHPNIYFDIDERAIFFHDETLYHIYYDWLWNSNQGNDTGEFILRNLFTGERQIIAPWLNLDELAIDGPMRFNLNLYVSQKGDVTIIIPRSYGFDIAVELWEDLVAENKRYENVMQPVNWPYQGSPTFTHLLDDGEKNIYVIININKDGSKSLILLDHQEKSVTEYCLQPESPDFLTGSFVSPDNKYFAWNLINADNEVSGFVIFDRTVGKFAYVQDLKFSGWGMIEE